MSTGRLAIAISLYNRWDELGGLLDLLRRNWRSGPELRISVISTAREEEMPEWIDISLIDDLQFGSRYRMPTFPVLGRLQHVTGLTEMAARYQRRILKRIIRTRTVDSIIRGCQSGMQSGRDYTMHLHAAAWPLLEEKIYNLLKRMEKDEYVFAGRGYGKAWVDQKRPAGDIDDNFFVIQNQYAKERAFWNFDPAADAARITNEGRLARQVYEVCSPQAILLYDQFQNPQDYDFPPGSDQRRVQPYNYFKPMGLLRSHDLTQQARLCRQLQYHGPVLDTIIAQHEQLERTRT